MAKLLLSIDDSLSEAIERYIYQRKLNGEKINKSAWASELFKQAIDYKEPVVKEKGYVYFFQNDANFQVKIGKSVDPNERLKQISVKMPFDLIMIHRIKTNDMSKTESLFHMLYKYERRNGEWFELNDCDIEWIKNGQYTPDIEASIKGEISNV